MIAHYGFTDLYTSSFYPFQSEEEKWAYWSRHIDYARFEPEGKPLYKHLLELVQGKEYFVITTQTRSLKCRETTASCNVLRPAIPRGTATSRL